jgi:hypothetical protein
VPTGTSPSEPLLPEPPRPVRRPGAGPAATAEDLRSAQFRLELLNTELPRIRAEAAAWRNGLGVLLAALVGFGLIKGRSDVSTLDAAAAKAVGVLLALALVAGAVGALRLLRASFGKPSVVNVKSLPPAPLYAHSEALSSAEALRWGIRLTLACAVLLVAAVGVTWYGPPSATPQLAVDTGSAPACGSVTSVSGGYLVLDTSLGPQRISLANVTSMKPVSSCP